MPTYTLDPSALPAARRRGIRQNAIFFGLVTAVALAVANRGDFSPAGVVGLIVGGNTALLLATLITWAAVRTLDRQWATFQLTLTDEAISRSAAQVPDITIARASISAIEEYPETALVVRGATRRNAILIPVGLAGYAQVREQLATWQPITTRQGQRGLLLRCLGLGLIPAVALTMLGMASTPVLVLLIGAVILVGQGTLAVIIQRRRTSPRWVQIAVWCSLLLIPIIVLQRLAALS
jgi:hypothetical protein